ncbi:MAG: SDR family NAD(P)-dependent oxidoreductase [Chloroflexi bacterium]|nr:SDR family NAD(P)-dependent oxidoreductase [Chloroflexota bacterium]
MRYDFSGKRIFITGGAKGLGLEIAKAFVECNGQVAIADLSITEEKSLELIQRFGMAQCLCLDVADPVQVDSAFQQLGTVDVLVNNAGIYPTYDFFDLTPELWKQTIDIDLNSVFYCTQAAARQMIKAHQSGNIINITSIDALHPSWGHAHYCAAKAGVYSLTLSSASALGKYGIRVNAVAPGLVNRPTLKTDWPDGYQRFLAKAAIKTVPEASDIAAACIFLASDDAKAISGLEIHIDSGVLTAAPY